MDALQHAVVEALAQPHCAVCAVAASASRAYLQGIMRDGVNDAVIRNDWRRRGGLCARHWTVWRGLESPPLSSAILTRDLLASYLARGTPELDCRACRTSRESELRSLDALASTALATVGDALRSGRGFLCLGHLERLRATPLRDAFEERLEALLAELSEFIAKSDYRRAHEPRGSEGDSWLLAIRALGGDV